MLKKVVLFAFETVIHPRSPVWSNIIVKRHLAIIKGNNIPEVPGSFLWFVLVGQTRWSISWVKFVDQTGGSFSWVKRVRHSCGFNLLIILVGQTRGSNFWSFEAPWD